MTLCIHEMETDWCGICRPVAVDDISKPLATGPTIEAQHPGECAHCGDAIKPGDSITHSNEADGWCLTKHTAAKERPAETDIDLS